MSEHTEDSEQIRKDMLFLAGKLAHRGAQTDEEREAAHFLQRRFREYTPNVEIDDFSAIENYLYLFASYLTEFLVVAVLAVWFPAFATVYGIGVFLVYWAEFMGWRIFFTLHAPVRLTKCNRTVHGAPAQTSRDRHRPL